MKSTLFIKVLYFLANTSHASITTIFLIQILYGIIPIITLTTIQRLIDSLSLFANSSDIKNVNFYSLSTLLLAWFIASLIESGLPILSTLIQGKLGEKLALKINVGLMRKTNNFSDIRVYEDPEFYNQLQLLREEANQQPSLLINNLFFFGRLVFSSLAVISILFSLAWWIPIVILAILIPQSYLGTLIENRAWEMANSKSSRVREMSYFSSVLLSSTYVKEVRLFNLGEYFIRKYIDSFQDWHRTKNKIRKNEFLWSSATGLIVTSTIASIFLWLIYRASLGFSSPGSLFIFIQSLSYLDHSVNGLVSAPPMLAESLLYMQRYFSFIDQEDCSSLDTANHAISQQAPIGIEFVNISFTYPNGREALSNLYFQISPGKTVAIVGENGSGKTTIIKLLLKFYAPSSGVIYLNGVDINHLNTQELRRVASGVFQDFGQYSCSLEDNIKLSNLVSGESIHQAANSQLENHHLYEVMTESGVNTFVNLLPNQEKTLLGKEFGGTELSGGQWQKIAVARALYRKGSQLLILDEPTAALDPRSEFELFTQFSQLARGKTTLLITHRLASARMADLILVLKQGHLVEQGTHSELLAMEGEYAELWSMQAQYYQDFGDSSQPQSI